MNQKHWKYHKEKIYMKKCLSVVILGLAILTVTTCKTGQIKSQETTFEIISEEIIVGKGGEWELSGLLTLPRDARGKIPAVVLVHGSGPQDMDETVMANKPFKDIAEYLASQGIAVLRYNKRTFTHPEKMVAVLGGSLSVYEETIEDAILATELLKADPRINENKVFIIGHSLGGMLAPRIHASGANFAGLILMAGSPRFLLDISYDQNIDYIENTLEGEEKEIAYASLAGWDEQVNTIVNLPDDVAKSISMGGGTSAYYYKDLYDHPAAAYINNVRVPYLVLQGSADFQVKVDKDFALYKELLAGRDNVTFILYEGLNHLFITSTTGNIDEYNTPGNVDRQVLQDIVNWIKLQ
jgi:dipeptidyl aminopeptidase/acylaminoacyl peptidase